MQDLINNIIVVSTDYRYLIAGAALLAWLLISAGIIKLLYETTKILTHKTASELDDTLLKEARFPLWIILIISGLFIISRIVEIPEQALPYVNRFTQLSIIFAVIYFFLRSLIVLSNLAGRRNSAMRNMVPTFSRITNVLVWGIGIFMLMDIFGISITPLMASLGIAGLAIGLALQDTLSNFFSGIYILLSQPVRVGDYIELENGLKGYVTSIGWRETRIRTLPNNMVVIPNAKLSQSIITNFYVPQTEMACLVEVGVSYESDLEKVEKITIEIGKEVQQRVNGGVKDFEPFIRYHTFNDFSIDFTVILRVNEFVDQYLLKHEFVKALHRRYNQEGINIPFPIRTVVMKEDKK